MHFKRTLFRGFRNIEPQGINWSPGLNLIVGSNGSGKTNLIEGLNLIAGWGPLEKGTRISSLIQWEKTAEGSLLAAEVAGEDTGEISAKISTRSVLRWDGKPIGASEMRYKLPVLTFLPGHLSLIRGSASYRRALLDVLGALISPSYARRLHDYRHILKQRVALLRRGCSPVSTDGLLRGVGAWIWKVREILTCQLSKGLDEFSGLLPCPVHLSFIRGGGGLAPLPEEDFRLSMACCGEKERIVKVPQVGPHRDDIRIECLGRPASDVLSRGHRRRTAVAMMLVSCRLVEKNLGKLPVLLLDEVTAELDKEGRDLLLSALSEGGRQVFAATTEIEKRPSAAVYRVQSGGILF